ncbi:hypothetical protein C8J57DRAFT_1519089 [Mycena rebaudengoi]|nr:hypothetical protein C8J57DRAFT_1519089 [Mycena rebaudengoi]
MASSSICFQADPDISGIGVRVAIYIQCALWDKKVSMAELDAVEKQSTTILMTAFAIVVSAIAETRTASLSNFHASIFSACWMNNTNTFIFSALRSAQKPG